ncbi:alkane 1-monooxygenase [Halospina denitrificans]|uniref:Alkane 1-monooxygenase n=1 Tax=Halospina denitrificans TaxID=332522 RepID=A0A4R7JIR2_9GAMM|nr:alkane 1-monooxygenase [Halospina denitrificans]TDT37811.1 alkane 1-monooxygenase [Halospina denitrificans]
MLKHVPPEVMLRIKRYAYLLVLVVPAIAAYVSYQLTLGENIMFWAWFPVIFIFGIIPVIDYIIGKDPANPDEDNEVPGMTNDWYYRILTMGCVPIHLAVIVYAGWAFATVEMSLVAQFGWILSIGVVGGIMAINIGHELIHKDTKLETWVGGLALASVTYAGFKVEHIMGHHVHVSTPEDASSSRYNQGVYAFLAQAFPRNFMNAWKLEAKKLRRKGKTPYGPANELIWWYTISALFAVGFTVAFGWAGLVFFLGQSFFAAFTLEVINYLEHYGLHRRVQENGRFERVTPAHSWNSNYLLTNLFLFHLQRHSDHHAFPRRRYQVLRHYDESPQLPGGYASMFVLALVPPLWKWVMNPRVEAYYQGELDQLFREQRPYSKA